MFKSRRKRKFNLKLLMLWSSLLILILYGIYKLLSPNTKPESLNLSLKELDISTQKRYVCSKNSPGKVWLISYANGDEVHYMNQKTLVYSGLNNCIDNFLNYNETDLNEDFKTKNIETLNAKRGAGYWLWKPYIILKALSMIPENDIIIYADSGIMLKRGIENFLEQLNNKDIILTSLPFKVGHWTKRDLLKYMDMDNEEIRNKLQIQASILFLRNTEYTRNFIKKWLEICQHRNLINDSPSKNEYSDFRENRHDQAILTLLYYKDPTNISVIPDNRSYEKNSSMPWYLHHRRDVNHPLLVE